MEPRAKYSFNLVQEPWLPCWFPDGTPADLSLHAALVRAHEVREVAHASPLVTVALHRLLLAVVHRVCGPASDEEWHVLWQSGALDEAAVGAYLNRWQHRFDLFDEDRPFYQAPMPPNSNRWPVTRLAHELGAGTEPFSHTLDDRPQPLLPPEAARYVVAYQAFAVGGLLRQPGDPQSAKGSPLVKGAVLLLQGRSLFETLLLNLVRLDGNAGAPFEFDPTKDRPAWEQDEPPALGERRPDGYLDLLTWQSRRLLLLPEGLPEAPRTTRVIVREGFRFPDSWEPHLRETMVAFRKNEKASRGQDPWQPVGFRPARALWRDSLTLLKRDPSADSKNRPPRTFEDLAERVQGGFLPDGYSAGLAALGLSSDRAKVLLWRHERLPLPLRYLRDAELLSALGSALATAEKARDVLTATVTGMAQAMLSPDPVRKPELSQVRALAASLGAEPVYWAALDVPFRQFMVDLADTWPTDRGAGPIATWHQQLRRAAWDAFETAAGALETSARGLRAAAGARNQFRQRLAQAVPSEKPEEAEEPEGGDPA